MFTKIIAGIFLLFCWNVSASGEVVYLKNGKKVEGQILERTGKKIKVQVKGVASTYYLDEIDKIESSSSGPSITSKPLSAPLKSRPAAAVPATPPLTSEMPIEGSFRDNPAVAAMSKFQLIMRLMELTGQKDNLNQTLASVIAQAPAEEKEKMRVLFNSDEILTQLIPVYDRNFSLEELRDLVAFYESPVGKKLHKVTPILMQQVMEATMQYFENKLQGVANP